MPLDVRLEEKLIAENKRMAFETEIFQDAQLQADYLDWLVDTRWIDIQGHFEQLWNYYANPKIEITNSRLSESGRCYVQAQEFGLPGRITGYLYTGHSDLLGARALKDVQRKEVVIENDIAWRINAAVDFLFGKPVSLVSKSPDNRKSAEIETLLKALFRPTVRSDFSRTWQCSEVFTVSSIASSGLAMRSSSESPLLPSKTSQRIPVQRDPSKTHNDWYKQSDWN